MAGFCKCGDGLSNLGVLSCPRILNSVKKHIRVSTFDSTGNRNSILLTDMVDGKLSEAYILGKLNETDASKKWYLTPSSYENVEPSRTDSSFEDFSSGARVKVDTGVKEFAGIIPQLDAQIASKLNAGACGSFGHYEIDTAGSIKGEMSIDETELYPITVAKGSYEAVEIEAVEGTSVQRISITFQYDKSVNEGQLRIIPADAIEVSLLQINGALDGDLEETGVASATSFSATFSIDCFGYFGEIIPIEGQVEPSDWSIYDTGLNNIIPSGIVELIPGQYDFTIPSTPAETLTIKFIGTPDSVLDQAFESDSLIVVTP